MATAEAKLATKALERRRALAEQLVDLQVQHRSTFAQMDGLKSDLKKIATDAGANFKEEFSGRGQVAVSAAHGKTFKGTVPTLSVEAWFNLPKSRQQKLLDGGLVKLVDEYTGGYYGGVTVKLFDQAG